MSTRIFERLFPSLGHDGFIRSAYPTRPVIEHAPPSRLGPLWDDPRFDDPAALIETAPPYPRPVAYVRGPEGGPTRQIRTDPVTAAALYRRGATVALDDGQPIAAEIGAWNRRMTRELGLGRRESPVALVASPAGEGVPTHFDGLEVIVIQLRGRKRWRLAANEVHEHPTFRFLPGEGGRPARDRNVQAQAFADELQVPDMEDAQTTVLEPGSALFLPRGWWHTTECLEPSISLTFRLAAMTGFRAVADAIASELANHAAWRCPLAAPIGELDAPTEEALTVLVERAQAALPGLLSQLALRRVLTGPQYAPTREQPLHFDHDASRIVVGASSADPRCLPVPATVAPIVTWLAERQAPFAERDALACAPDADLRDLDRALAWLCSVGFLVRLNA